MMCLQPAARDYLLFGCSGTFNAYAHSEQAVKSPSFIWLVTSNRVCCPHCLLQAVQLPKLQSLHLPHWDNGDCSSSRSSSSSTSSSTGNSNDNNSNCIPRMPAAAAAHLTALTRLQLPDLRCLPGGLQLPGLKVASVLSGKLDVAAVAAFAPNLQQLCCIRLEIPSTAAATTAATAPAVPVSANTSTAAHAGAIAAATPAASVAAALPHCTHFGGQAVCVTGAACPAAAAAAFAAAFPSLAVMFRVPLV